MLLLYAWKASLMCIMSRSNECKELPPIEFLRECFDYEPDTGVLRWKKARPRDHFQTESKWKQYMTQRAGKEAGCKHLKKNGKKAYIQVGMYNISSRWTAKSMLLVHRVCAALVGLPVTKDVLVDHRDGDVWNHKKDNLRIANHSQSSMNCREHSDRKSTLPRGVVPNNRGGGYSARISLGTFRTPELAYEAICKAARLFHGEFSSYERGVIEGSSQTVDCEPNQ